MRSKISSVIGFVTGLMMQSGLAQQTGCDFESAFAEFDFWIGEWEVFDNASGGRAGSNSIKKLEQNDPDTETWNVWFDGRYVRRE